MASLKFLSIPNYDLDGNYGTTNYFSDTPAFVQKMGAETGVTAIVDYDLQHASNKR